MVVEQLKSIVYPKASTMLQVGGRVDACAGACMAGRQDVDRSKEKECGSPEVLSTCSDMLVQKGIHRPVAKLAKEYPSINQSSLQACSIQSRRIDASSP